MYEGFFLHLWRLGGLGRGNSAPGDGHEAAVLGHRTADLQPPAGVDAGVHRKVKALSPGTQVGHPDGGIGRAQNEVVGASSRCAGEIGEQVASAKLADARALLAIAPNRGPRHKLSSADLRARAAPRREEARAPRPSLRPSLRHSTGSQCHARPHAARRARRSQQTRRAGGRSEDGSSRSTGEATPPSPGGAPHPVTSRTLARRGRAGPPREAAAGSRLHSTVPIRHAAHTLAASAAKSDGLAKCQRSVSW